MLVFKVGILKALFAEFLPTICIVIIEMIITRIFLILFHCTYEMLAYVPIYRMSAIILIYLLLFAIYKIISYHHFNTTSFDNISKKNKFMLFVNIIIALIVAFIQMYLIGYYNDKLPTFIILINTENFRRWALINRKIRLIIPGTLFRNFPISISWSLRIMPISLGVNVEYMCSIKKVIFSRPWGRSVGDLVNIWECTTVCSSPTIVFCMSWTIRNIFVIP